MVIILLLRKSGYVLLMVRTAVLSSLHHAATFCRDAVIEICCRLIVRKVGEVLSFWVLIQFRKMRGGSGSPCDIFYLSWTVWIRLTPFLVQDVLDSSSNICIETKTYKAIIKRVSGKANQGQVWDKQ